MHAPAPASVVSLIDERYGSDPDAVLDLCRPGYGLARRALAEGIELGVCAPGKTAAAHQIAQLLTLDPTGS